MGAHPLERAKAGGAVIVAALALRADPGALAQVVCARCDQVFLSDQPTRWSRHAAGWVHEVCPAATDFTIGPDREAEAITWSRRALPEPIPPTSPLAAPVMQVMRAWIEACAAHPDDSQAVVARVESAVLRILARWAGHTPATDRYQLPGEIRLLFAEPGQAADRLLGYWVKRRRGGRVFYPGLAGLEPREAETLWRAMDGLAEEQIAREMWPARDGNRPAIESVDGWMSSGRAKLREAFGLTAGAEVARLAMGTLSASSPGLTGLRLLASGDSPARAMAGWVA